MSTIEKNEKEFHAMEDTSAQSPIKEKRSSKVIKNILSLMVVVYGLATAGAAYQVRVFTAKTTRANNVGLIELVRANDAFSQADQIANMDRELITGLWLSDARNESEEVVDILIGNISPEAFDSIERSGDLDDEYVSDIYAYAHEVYNNAFVAFQTSSELSAIKNEYDLIVLMLAIGVAFTAWASFIERSPTIRYVFAFSALLILVFSIWVWMGVITKELPTDVAPLASLIIPLS